MSIENSPGPDFLREKYKLQSSPEVERAKERKEKQTGKKMPEDANTRIQNYLDRFQAVLNPPKLEGHENFDRSQRNIEMLKSMLYKQFIIKPEEIPEGYFQNIIQRHEEEGHPIEEIPPEIRTEIVETLIKDQENSLDIWVDYLTSADAKYPDWLKYFAFRSLLVMGRYDKEKKKFTERSKSGKNVSPFPDLNREALGYVFDAMEKKQASESINFPYDIQSEEQDEFRQYLDRGNFAKLYAWAIEKINPVSEEMLKKIEGEWRTFPKDSDHLLLASSLENYGTGWCIRGESTAKRYLSESDLEIFYSLDENNEPKIPRVVIVTDSNDQISEVRGIAEQENLDPYIGTVVDQKLDKLPDGKKYEKRSSDMKSLTRIKNKTRIGQNLTKDDLIFLYEIDSQIDSFGYQRDPRIIELRAERNPKEDAPIVFDCAPSEIAWSEQEINKNTKAYIGLLSIGIIHQLSHLEHIYTSFPEDPIHKSELEIGGKSVQELINLMHDKNIQIDPYAQDMLDNPDFTAQDIPENLELIKLNLRSLGFEHNPTTAEIIGTKEDKDKQGNPVPFTSGKMTELGLNLCPAEVGPHQRLKDLEQPVGDWYRIAMKPFADRNGYPYVFNLARNGSGLWLYSYWAGPDYGWYLDRKLVFCLRKFT